MELFPMVRDYFPVMWFMARFRSSQVLYGGPHFLVMKLYGYNMAVISSGQPNEKSQGESARGKSHLL